MSLINQWVLYRRHVLPHLDDGERVLEFSSSALSTGVAPSIRPGSPVARSAMDKVEDAVGSALTGGWIPANPILGLVAGWACDGGPGSTAVVLHHTLLKRSTHVEIAVTDRRLLIFVDGDFVDNERSLSLAWQIGRDEIIGAEVGWWLLAFGRLRIWFRDYSWIVFSSMPLMGRRRARKLAAALIPAAENLLPGLPDPEGRIGREP